MIGPDNQTALEQLHTILKSSGAVQVNYDDASRKDYPELVSNLQALINQEVRQALDSVQKSSELEPCWKHSPEGERMLHEAQVVNAIDLIRKRYSDE